MKSVIWCALLVALSLCFAGAGGEAAEETQTLAWATAGEELGSTLACHGDAAVLGAPGAGGTGDRFFLAVYDAGTGQWSNADEISAGTSFVSLAMDGQTVAAVLDDQVELYSWSGDGLLPQQTITGSSPRAVAVDGDFLAVGRFFLSFPVSAGLVTMHVWDAGLQSWEFEDSLQETVTFGFAVALSGTRLVIGHSGATGTTGQAWIVSRNTTPPYTWGGIAYQATDAELNNHFGAAVALDGRLCAVGAPQDDNEGGVDAGIVYLYQKPLGGGYFEPDGVLVSPDPGADGRFGASVALDDPYLVVGEPGAGGLANPQAGAAHLFQRGEGGWQLVTTLTRLSPSAGEELGTTVCLTNDGVLAGVPFADGNGADSGEVLYFGGLFTLFADGFECGCTSAWSAAVP